MHKVHEDQHGNLLDPEGAVLAAAEERSRCEVWTRVMGYHRPIAAFNKGKQQEHKDRTTFRMEAPRTV